MLSIASAFLRRHVGEVSRYQHYLVAHQSRSIASAFVGASHASFPEKQVILKGSSVWRHPSVGSTASLRPPHNAAPSCAVWSGLSSPWCCESMRGFAATSKLRPKFRGGKIKTSGGFKERFKLTGTGKIRHMRTGHRHKRWAKSSDQNRALRKGRNLFNTYAVTLKKLGFTRRTF